MKKILIDAYLEKNLGDDLFLKVLFERYKDSKIEWIIYTSDLSYSETFNSYNNITFKKRNFLQRIFYKLSLFKLLILSYNYKKIDGYLIIGGSIFMEVENWKKIYNYRKQFINLFVKNKKPTWILGANFGPYYNEEFLDKYNDLFNICTDVCFRDRHSYDIFCKNKKVRVAPDIVFGLEAPNSQSIKNTVGFSLINLKNRKKLFKYNEIYKNKVIDVLENLLKEDKKITLFSFCQLEGDDEFIEEIKNHINSPNISIVKYKGNIDEFLEQYQKQENIIGVRFHSIILSQVFKQGVFPIIYSEKVINVLEDINLDEKYIYIENISNLKNKEILNINNNKIPNIEYLKKESQKHFEVLDKYV